MINQKGGVKNIVLVGFMGSGKTTIATKLASRLKARYVSTDDLIVEREKRTINEIFTKSGEDYFRDVEGRVIKEISGQEGLVIDAGGGAVLREENMTNLKSNGVVICLTADDETIMARTKKYKHRVLGLNLYIRQQFLTRQAFTPSVHNYASAEKPFG